MQIRVTVRFHNQDRAETKSHVARSRRRRQRKRRLEMKINSLSHRCPGTLHFLTAVTCGALVLALTPLGEAMRLPAPRASQDQTAAAKIPSEQLDSLVAPIALYPD